MPRDIEDLVRSGELADFRYQELATAQQREGAAPRWPLLVATDRLYRARSGALAQPATAVEQPAAQLWDGDES